MSSEMAAASLCDGKVWQSSFEMEWHRCEEDSNGYATRQEGSSDVSESSEGGLPEPKWTSAQRKLMARWENEMANCDPASEAFAEVEAACDRLDLVEQEMRISGICTEPVPDSGAVTLVRCR
jgi:hypothetical protein